MSVFIVGAASGSPNDPGLRSVCVRAPVHVCVFFHLFFKEAVSQVDCRGTKVAATDAVLFQILHALSKGKLRRYHPPH